MLERLRIGPKLLLAPCMVLLLLIVSSSSAWYAMVRQNQAVDMIVNERAARIREAGELATEAQQAHARMYQLLTWISASFSAPRVDALGQDMARPSSQASATLSSQHTSIAVAATFIMGEATSPCWCRRSAISTGSAGSAPLRIWSTMGAAVSITCLKKYAAAARVGAMNRQARRRRPR